MKHDLSAESHEGAHLDQIRQQGLRIVPIDEAAFRDFAARCATSPEIGRIATALDGDKPTEIQGRRHLIGLKGCGKLCAAACLELYDSRMGAREQVLKLDSVIVDPELRRRGLGLLLVTQVFLDLVRDEANDIVRIYAHAVHPATVRLLKSLSFSDPPPIGAPISHVGLEGEEREAVLRDWETRVRDDTARKRLDCEFCRNRSRRARPWCVARGVVPKGPGEPEAAP